MPSTEFVPQWCGTINKSLITWRRVCKHRLCMYLMTWHGKVRTEWRTLSAAPRNLGSGLSRETPAFESFLSHKGREAFIETSETQSI